MNFLYHSHILLNTQALFTHGELHIETVCSAQLLHTHTHTCYTGFLTSILVYPSAGHFTSYLCYGHVMILDGVQQRSQHSNF
jgi:hypothetical protein